VIGSNALFCYARYGWTAADLLAGKIDVSNSYFQKYVLIHLVDLRSVLLGLYLKFYVFGSFLQQLSEINEIISALCTVAL